MVKRQNSSSASSVRHDESKHQRRSSTSSRQRRRGEEDGNNESNLDSTDPYEILGVGRSATAQQIRSSYKRLALRYHPDRVSPSDKDDANRRFVAIANAFEVLGDEERRREFDEGRRGGDSDFLDGSGGFRNPFAGFDRDPFSRPFFGADRGDGPRQGFHFTDPFEMFNHVFGEMRRGGGGHHQSRHTSSSGRGDPFSDPFFSRDPFASDPFFSGPLMGGGGMFGGMGSMGQMMSSHMDSMNLMMSQMHGGMSQQQIMGGGNGSFNFATSSYSSGVGGRQSVSRSTRTSIVNGVRTTVTERTVVHPDGRVERHVETAGGNPDERRRLPQPGSSRPALGQGGDDRRRTRRR